MSRNNSFLSARPFYGKDNFPYGISRSGEFSKQQASMLEEHGYAYEALASRLREPATKEEKDFVKVFTGKKAAESMHEKVWQRYIEKVLDKANYVPSACLGNKSFNDNYLENDNIY